MDKEQHAELVMLQIEIEKHLQPLAAIFNSKCQVSLLVRDTTKADGTGDLLISNDDLELVKRSIEQRIEDSLKMEPKDSQKIYNEMIRPKGRG